MRLRYSVFKLTPACSSWPQLWLELRGVQEDISISDVWYNLQRKINPVQNLISRFLPDSFFLSPLYHGSCTCDQLQGFSIVLFSPFHFPLSFQKKKMKITKSFASTYLYTQKNEFSDLFNKVHMMAKRPPEVSRQDVHALYINKYFHKKIFNNFYTSRTVLHLQSAETKALRSLSCSSLQNTSASADTTLEEVVLQNCQNQQYSSSIHSTNICWRPTMIQALF